jgi:hypothetical protein
VIVKRIEALEIGIGRAEGEMGRIRRQLQEVVQRRAAIEQQRDQFRQRGYDSPYGGFGNEAVLANVLGGILGGVIQGAVLGQVLNQGYHRRPGPWDSDFGGGGAFPFPFPQDGGGGGGWIGGGGGFETGGGFGGGAASSAPAAGSERGPDGTGRRVRRVPTPGLTLGRRVPHGRVLSGKPDGTVRRVPAPAVPHQDDQFSLKSP